MDLREALTRRIDSLNKPKGSLGMLEDVALRVGLTQGTLRPRLSCPTHLLLAADHGIEREGVSASPREVTWQQLLNFTRGGGAVNMLCRQHGFRLRLVDVGVDHDMAAHKAEGLLSRKVMPRGTRNFLREPAMSAEELSRCLAIGRELADECIASGSNVVSLGEMGIGNTSASALWMHLLTSVPLAHCVGRGSGLNDEGVRHKLGVLEACLRRTRPSAPLDVMREFGGLEMNVAVGAMLSLAGRGATILVDGFIMTACALMASRLEPSVLADCIFCHKGDEAGHRLMLEALDAQPLLSLGLRLGEGTGALAAYPLVDTAVRMLTEMNTFEGANITKYF